MPEYLTNPHRGRGILPQVPRAKDDPSGVAALLAECPAHARTPLHNLPELARRAGVAEVHVKDECARMGLGSFKALGAAHAVARDANAAKQGDWTTALQGRTYVCASAGNHGLSVAAGARLFGARAVVYLADTVPEAFAARLAAKGAEVVRAGAAYEASLEAAMQAAEDNGWTLLSDSSWDGYLDMPMAVMEGYLQMAEETARQIPAPPTHILLQAGVGGLAAAVAAHARKTWGDAPQILVVEPAYAVALQASIRAGEMVTTPGPVSQMGRLDCKTPSLIALATLSKDADAFVTITEEEAHAGVATLADLGLQTTPSGGAGVAALLAGCARIGDDARVLTFLSEGPEDG